MIRNQANQRVEFSLFKSGLRIANPTLTAADFRVTLDGGAQNPVAVTPTSDAAGRVTWLPSQAETNARYVTLLCNDAAGAEWEPLTIAWDTLAETTAVTYLDATVSSRAVPGDLMGLTIATIVSIASAVWSFATRTLTDPARLIPGGGRQGTTWLVYQGDDLLRTIAAIASDATITKAQLTVKCKWSDTDAQAILAVDTDTGLLRLNGAAPGAFTATFALPAGTLDVPALTMAELPAEALQYDIKVWRGARRSTIERGTFTVTASATGTVTP